VFRANGSDGWDSTGAATTGSTIIASAKLPVRHMPTTPTPRPPHCSCSWRARALAHSVAGEVLLRAQVANSLDTQAHAIDWAV
jgi:hypothetical protein